MIGYKSYFLTYSSLINDLCYHLVLKKSIPASL